MRARSIVIISLLLATAVLPGVGFAFEAVARHHGASVPATESWHKADIAAAIDSQNFDIRLASLEPRDLLQDRAGLSDIGARHAAANLAVSRLPSQQAPLIAPTPRLTFGSQPGTRETSDYWLMGLVAAMLVAYQLRRKHRFLRPQPFSS